VDDPTAEFLGEAIEIMSVGMDHETLFNVDHDTTNAAGTRFRATNGLLDDAGRAYNNWIAMPVANRRTHWGRLVEVRRRLRARVAGTYSPTSTQDQADWAAATAVEQTEWNDLIADYNALRRP